MSGILSIIDKESEYSRIHSYLEFIVHPEHLDAHVRKILIFFFPTQVLFHQN
jgi:hypothetical protein